MTAEWHYAVGGEKKGPVSEEELCELFRTGALTSEALVWKKGMTAWQAASTVEVLSLAQAEDGPPPLPGSAPPHLPVQSTTETQIYYPPPLPENFAVANLRHPWNTTHNMPEWLLSKWTAELAETCESYRTRFDSDQYFVGSQVVEAKWKHRMYQTLAIPPVEQVIAWVEWGGLVRGSTGLAFTPVAFYWRINAGVGVGPFRMPFVYLVNCQPHLHGSEPFYGNKDAGIFSGDRTNLGGRGEYDLLIELARRFLLACGHTPVGGQS